MRAEPAGETPALQKIAPKWHSSAPKTFKKVLAISDVQAMLLGLLDSLELPKHGKSQVNIGSVMI
jgi:hypothetical protein